MLGSSGSAVYRRRHVCRHGRSCGAMSAQSRPSVARRAAMPAACRRWSDGFRDARRVCRASSAATSRRSRRFAAAPSLSILVSTDLIGERRPRRSSAISGAVGLLDAVPRIDQQADAAQAARGRADSAAPAGSSP